jgi:hypothetical protein
MMDQAKIRRESLRWYLLLALYNARPEELSEGPIQMTMQSIYPDVTPIEVRRELDYLGDRSWLICAKNLQVAGGAA